MFKELYYWMYSYVRRLGPNQPAYRSGLLIGLLQVLNIGTIQILLENFFDLGLMRKIGATYWGLTVSFILFVFDYFDFYLKKDIICMHYENLSTRRRRKGKLYFWLYVLMSIFLFLYMVANLVTPRYK